MNKEMKILHISAPGYRNAGKLAFDIHKLFLKEGFKSFIISKLLDSEIENSYSYYNKYFKWIKKFYISLFFHINKIYGKKREDSKYGFIDITENRSQLKYRKLLNKVPFNPDIVILYALQGFINVKIISEIQKKTGAKIYWLLYDMFAMTGGCHYSWDCKGFEQDCGMCPALFSKDKYDASNNNMRMKKKCFNELELNIFPVSEWLYCNSMKSSLFKGKNIIEWMIPIDIGTFKPENKSEVRKELCLDPCKKYIFFGAVSLTNERKGFEYLVKAIEILKDADINPDDYEILVLGMNAGDLGLDTNIKTNCIGLINDKKVLAKYYQAAHVVVIPSVQDAGPLMTAEAISCGTPVVCFDMGFARNFIKDKNTGYIATLFDSEDLAHGIIKILKLTDDEYEQYSGNCRQTAEQYLNFETQFNKLVDILSK